MPTTTPDSEGFSWWNGLPYTLWRTHNAVNRVLHDAVKDLGVTVTQLGLSVHLNQLGALSASDLSRGIHITPQSVATALNRLENLGWVTRRPHPVHGRVVLFSLTDRGRDGVREGSARMAEVTKRVTSVLPDAGADTVRELRLILLELEGSDRSMEPLWPIRDL